MDYAIETSNLLKKYPTTVGSTSGRRGHRGMGRGGVGSFAGLNLFRRASHFIEALRGVTLEIGKGETFGILGPNGAGKTTLIKILCTMVLPDSGEVNVNGFNVVENPNAVLRSLQAVLPESRGFSWRLTGRQNLEFYALLYGLQKKEAEERIDYLLEFTGLQDRADDWYQRYSTGMQRKLLLCRSLLRDTPILLFDEPTTGLDPGAAAEFREMLHKKLAKEEGKTIMISTHNLYEAQEMCDRIAILDRGEITACDTPDKIRYMMFDQREFNITFHQTLHNDQHKKMVDELETLHGVYAATPQIDPEGFFEGITFRIDKNMNLSQILQIIITNNLKIKATNTEEPTLEDAFIAITGQLPSQEKRLRGHRPWRFR